MKIERTVVIPVYPHDVEWGATAEISIMADFRLALESEQDLKALWDKLHGMEEHQCCPTIETFIRHGGEFGKNAADRGASEMSVTICIDTDEDETMIKIGDNSKQGFSDAFCEAVRRNNPEAYKQLLEQGLPVAYGNLMGSERFMTEGKSGKLGGNGMGLAQVASQLDRLEGRFCMQALPDGGTQLILTSPMIVERPFSALADRKSQLSGGDDGYGGSRDASPNTLPEEGPKEFKGVGASSILARRRAKRVVMPLTSLGASQQGMFSTALAQQRSAEAPFGSKTSTGEDDKEEVRP